MICLIWSAALSGFRTLVIFMSLSVSVWMRTIMSPEFTILAEIDLMTSRSLKPAGEMTFVFCVRIPVLISRLSLCRM